jgi:hypothetical protein
MGAKISTAETRRTPKKGFKNSVALRTFFQRKDARFKPLKRFGNGESATTLLKQGVNER